MHSTYSNALEATIKDAIGCAFEATIKVQLDVVYEKWKFTHIPKRIWGLGNIEMTDEIYSSDTLRKQHK